MSNRLLVVPLGNTSRHLFQEVFMVLQDLRDLIKDLVHEKRVHHGAAVWLLEGTHVALKTHTHTHTYSTSRNRRKLPDWPEVLVPVLVLKR